MSRRSNYNASSLQDRLPALLFVIIGIILVNQFTLLLVQYKSIQLPLPQPVFAWNSVSTITTIRKYARSFVSTKYTESVPTCTNVRKFQLNSHKYDEQSTNNELDSTFHSISSQAQRTGTSIVLCTAIICSTLSTTGVIYPSIVNGYDDYISEPVQIAIKAVQDANTNDALVKAYEAIAEIITEGKGVGGSINFQGVQLDRGYVSDEDTSIYNPGLTLLTETEKTRLVDTVVESKKRQLGMVGGSTTTAGSNWNGDLEAGYSFLRDRLDPLHMYELHGYLSMLPIFGAIMYLVALAVQQISRDVFPTAYIICATVVFVPIVVLVLLGPQ